MLCIGFGLLGGLRPFTAQAIHLNYAENIKRRKKEIKNFSTRLTEEAPHAASACKYHYTAKVISNKNELSQPNESQTDGVNQQCAKFSERLGHVKTETETETPAPNVSSRTQGSCAVKFICSLLRPGWW